MPKIRVIAPGYIGSKLRKPGEVLFVEPDQFSARWMVNLDPPAPEPVAEDAAAAAAALKGKKVAKPVAPDGEPDAEGKPEDAATGGEG